MSYRVNKDIDNEYFWRNESFRVIEWIGSFLGVFEDMSGKLSSSQVVNNQVKMFRFFIRWLRKIKHLSSRQENSSCIIGG